MSATPWASGTPASVSRKNKTSVISDTGSNLAALDKTQFKIVTATSTAGGFTLNHVYFFSEDGTTVIDLTAIEDHQHTGAGNGGSVIDILRNNPETLDLNLLKHTDFSSGNGWTSTVTGTGTVEYDNGGGASKRYIRLRPNGTSGSGSTISYTYNLNVSFASSSIFVATGNFETATSLAFHCGVNADDVTAADSNTRKYQAEVCTTTNNNWWLRTANGSANSASDLGVAITANDTSIKMVHKPSAPEVKMEIDAANEFIKTTNIPTSGTNTTGNILKFSIKNNTGADRPYRFKGCRLSFVTEDSWGYG